MHRKELWAILIVVVAGTAMLVYTATRAIGQVIAFGNSGLTAVDRAELSGWQTYRNQNAGFTLEYPSDWQISNAGLSGTDPFVALGNPLEGTSTYVIYIFIENNSSSLSSGDYVHQLLAADRAQDAVNAKAGPAPQITPEFTKSYVLGAGSGGMYAAYELFDVFEFDHNAERIYVARGNEILRFDFPVADENPNISLPVINNTTAHRILGTLVW